MAPMTPCRPGDSGPAVVEISRLLTRTGHLPARAEVYDEEMERGVRAFQQEQGLSVDGVVGPSTYRRLHEATWTLGDRVLNHLPGRQLSGDDVFELQRRLLELGFRVGRVDGVFGPTTETGLRDFQRNYGLPDDGTCGPATLKAFARLRPLVSGGAPNTLRAQARVDRAGPALSGKRVVLDPMPPRVVDGDLLARGERIVFDVVHRLEGRLAALGVEALVAARPGEAYDESARADFANRCDADLTLSLTLDSDTNPHAGGVASYFWGSDRHATHSSTGERLAGLVQREVTARTDLVDLRAHPKSWDFLRGTRMPAVRVDTGYLTHAGDLQRLKQPAFRDTLAEALLVAIQRFYLSADADARTGVLSMSDLREGVAALAREHGR